MLLISFREVWIFVKNKFSNQNYNFFVCFATVTRKDHVLKKFMFLFMSKAFLHILKEVNYILY